MELILTQNNKSGQRLTEGCRATVWPLDQDGIYKNGGKIPKTQRIKASNFTEIYHELTKRNLYSQKYNTQVATRRQNDNRETQKSRKWPKKEAETIPKLTKQTSIISGCKQQNKSTRKC